MNDLALATEATLHAQFFGAGRMQSRGVVRIDGDATLSTWLVSPGPMRIVDPTAHLLLLWTGAASTGPGAIGDLQRKTRITGDMDLLPAGAQLVCEAKAESNLFVLALPDATLRRFALELDAEAMTTPIAPFLLARDPRLAHVAWALRAEVDFGEVENSAYAQQLVMALGMHWLRRSRSAAQVTEVTRPARTPVEIYRALAHIEASLCSNLQVQELARAAGMSVSHFTSLFRRATGKSVHHYVVQKRVEKARDLLLRGKASVCDVALEAGFSHQSHLARWMRRLLGVTPRVLRLESRQMAGSDC
jgi:AraC family transcriptional regulator